MRPANLGDRLRKLLLDNIVGMTVKQMSDADGTAQDTVMAALYRNYGFYICGWHKVRANQYVAIWNCVRVPEKAAKPRGEFEEVDNYEAMMARKRADYRKRKVEERAKQNAIRLKLHAERVAQREREQIAARAARAEREAFRAQERIERAERRAKIAAERAAGKKAEKIIIESAPRDPSYVPQLTRWVPVAPWPEGERP